MVRAFACCCLFLFLAAPVQAWPPRLDAQGDPLPQRALARFGTVRWRHTALIQNAFYSSDGKTLVSHGQDKHVRVWDVPGGKQRAAYLALPNCWLVSLSVDGNTIVGLNQNDLYLLDMTNGKQRSVKLERCLPNCFALAPDGKTIAIGDGTSLSGEMNAVYLCDLQSGKRLRTLPAHVGGVRALAYAPDGKTFVSGGQDGSLAFWDTTTGKELRRLNGEPAHVGPVYCLIFSADGKTLVSGGNDACLREPDGKPRLRIAMPSQVLSVGLSTDSKRLAITSADYRVRCWDTSTSKELWSGPGIYLPGGVLSFSPDGKTLAVPGGTQTLRLYDVETGRWTNEQVGHSGQITGLTFSPDGKILASSAGDQVICLWDLAEGKLLRRLEYQGGGTPPVFSPDGKLVAVCGVDYFTKSIFLWDVDSGNLKAKMSVGGTPSLGYEVYQLAFTYDGKKLLAQTSTGPQNWDVASGKPLSRPREMRAQTSWPIVSPDGSCEAIHSTEGHDAILRQSSTGLGILPGMSFTLRNIFTLNDIASGTRLMRVAHEYKVTPNPVKGQASEKAPLGFLHHSFWDGKPAGFSRDGRQFLMRSGQHVRVIELASGKVLWQHDTGVTQSAQITHDGRAVMVAWADGKIALWNLLGEKNAGILQPDYKHHLQALSPDGRWLVTGHHDTSIVLWDARELAGIRRLPEPAKGRDLAALWDDLAVEDPQRAWAAIERLAVSPETVAFLKERLKPGPTEAESMIARAIRDLDAPRFAARDKAAKALQAQGALARPSLLAALAQRPTLEVRRRLETILNDSPLPDRLLPPGDMLRLARSIQVLERSTNPAARDLLLTLADGSPEAQMTLQAKAALLRSR